MKDIEAIATRRGARRADLYDDYSGQFEVTYQPKQSGVYNIYLFGAIVDPSQFIGAIEVMNRAGEDDLVVVHLQTPGGNIDATDTFISAMRECEADVLVQATGGVHSAGTIILMNAPMFKLSQNFNALVHNGSVVDGGKFSDFKIATKFGAHQHEALLLKTYEGFLSQDELTALLDGKDFWFDAESFGERYAQRQEFLKARHDEAEKQKQALAHELASPKLRPPRKKITNK